MEPEVAAGYRGAMPSSTSRRLAPRLDRAPPPRVLRRPALLVLVAAGLAGCGAEVPLPLPLPIPVPSDAGPSDARDGGAASDAAGQASDAGAVDAALDTPRFTADVWPIFAERCTGCHFIEDLPPRLFLPEQALPALLDGRSPTVALRWVEPGAPERSYLMLKLLGTHATVGGSGTIMPPAFEGTEPMPPAAIEVVRVWIAGGAPGP
jgi:hypothetical protein